MDVFKNCRTYLTYYVHTLLVTWEKNPENETQHN